MLPMLLRVMPRFSSRRGALEPTEGARQFAWTGAFYGLPVNSGTVTLERADQLVPERVEALVPFHAGEILSWRLLA